MGGTGVSMNEGGRVLVASSFAVEACVTRLGRFGRVLGAEIGEIRRGLSLGVEEEAPTGVAEVLTMVGGVVTTGGCFSEATESTRGRLGLEFGTGARTVGEAVLCLAKLGRFALLSEP